MTDATDSALPGYETRRPQLAREACDKSLFHHKDEQNVGHMERVASGLAGLLLVRCGLRRRSLLGKLLFGAAGGSLIHRAVTGYCPAYKAMRTSSAQQHPAKAEDYYQRGIHVESSHLIAAQPHTLYAFWRDVSNLPRIMRHLKKVERLTDTRSRWTAAGPLGRTVSWEAEIIHDIPNELIAWKSVGDSDVENAGSVHFTPHGTNTEVRVVLDYIPPAGQVGKLIAQMFGESPEQSINEDLERLKSIMAAREILHADGDPRGAVS